jgi:hypothetical protein
LASNPKTIDLGSISFIGTGIISYNLALDTTVGLPFPSLRTVIVCWQKSTDSDLTTFLDLSLGFTKHYYFWPNAVKFSNVAWQTQTNVEPNFWLENIEYTYQKEKDQFEHLQNLYTVGPKVGLIYLW